MGGIRLETEKKWKGEKMMTETHKIEKDIEISTFRTISLFMEWYLRKGSMAHNGELDMWLKSLGEASREEKAQWVAFARMDIISTALPSLQSLLERPLNDSERQFLDTTVVRFIDENGGGNSMELR